MARSDSGPAAVPDFSGDDGTRNQEVVFDCQDKMAMVSVRARGAEVIVTICPAESIALANCQDIPWAEGDEKVTKGLLDQC